MDLDALKKNWHQLSSVTHNQNIMDMIKRKHKGPLVSLKNSFRKQITALSIMPVVLLLTNMDNIQGTLGNILFISYCLFCVGVILFSYYNLRIVRKMEDMDGHVKTNLELHIHLLETRLQMAIMGMRFVLLFFVVLVEVVPYFQHYGTLDLWHSFHPVIRFGAYALLFIAQYYFSKLVNERKFGTHLNYLKQLVQEMN